MKYLRLLLCLSLVSLTANASLATADSDNSVRILLAKSDETTAQLTIGSNTYPAPISFEGGFTWSDVKDAYSVPPAFVSFIEDGRISVYIGCSGASFTVIPGTGHSKRKK